MQKFIILCIIRISNFTASYNRPVCFNPACCCSRSQCGQQDSRLFILSHSCTPSASLCGYATPPFGELWSCRWACSGAYTRGDRPVDRQRNCQRDCRAPTGRGDDRPRATACARQPRCWPWVWRYIRGQYPSLATSEGGMTKYRVNRADRILPACRPPEALPQSKTPQLG